ncbi:hypothetical protein OS176_02545 [Xanthomonadaceae bacterium XH05]|nr:hypothetical protein [Xanthomonadaceae bacterium XH05]
MKRVSSFSSAGLAVMLFASLLLPTCAKADVVVKEAAPVITDEVGPAGPDGLIKYIESLELRVKRLEMRDSQSSYFYWREIESGNGRPVQLGFQIARSHLGPDWEIVDSGRGLKPKQSGLYLVTLSFVKDAYTTGDRFHATRDDVFFELFRNEKLVLEAWEGEDSADGRSESTAFEVVCLREGDEITARFRSDADKAFRAYHPRILIELYSFDSCEAE